MRMKLITKQTNSLFHVLIICLLLIGCNSVKTVAFKTPVDTTTKPIDKQIKKIFEVKGLGVYASNDFDGAHLNDFKKVNDSTLLVVIKPENTPINNSAYFCI